VTVLAAIRPDSLNFPLLVHVLGASVLVGGLGLGVTARAVLADVRVEQLVIVEIEPMLVDWLRSGLVPR
jgi:spermidine synthase